MHRLETFCPLWPELNGTDSQQPDPARVYRPLRGRQPRRTAEERNSISPLFLLHRIGFRGEWGETDEAEGRNIISLEAGEVCEEEAGGRWNWIWCTLGLAGRSGRVRRQGWKRVSDLGDKDRTACHPLWLYVQQHLTSFSTRSATTPS